MRDQLHSLRSLSLHLSGSNVGHLGRDTARVRARCSCAETTSSASTQHAGTAAPASNGYHSRRRVRPMTDADTAWAVLAGHTCRHPGRQHH